ncbi:hypothetical protein OIU76_000543 [Salix suchowensis]|nr:hypothetical protein OIU76_000543 [Salix suchowensis]
MNSLHFALNDFGYGSFWRGAVLGFPFNLNLSAGAGLVFLGNKCGRVDFGKPVWALKKHGTGDFGLFAVQFGVSVRWLSCLAWLVSLLLRRVRGLKRRGQGEE